MSHRTPAAFALALSLAAVTLGSRPAHACGDSGIGGNDSSYVAPANGTTMPANVARLFFHSSSGCGGDEADTVTLVDDAGAAVPFTTSSSGGSGGSDVFLAPTTPLVQGKTYRLRYFDAFLVPANGSLGGCTTPVAKESSFTVGAPAPAPTSVGTASYATSARAILPSSCYAGSGDAVTAKLTVAVDASLAPYAGVARYETFVDGQPWASSRYGAPNAIDRPFSGQSPLPRTFDSIGALCDGTAGLAPGRHSVEIHATIEGGQIAPPPSLKLDIDLTCGGADGGTSPADAATDATGAAAPVESATNDAKCSSTAGAPGTVATFGLFVAGAALAGALRRRR
jgi:MYXO-CTERM domain-containing protein